MPVTTLHFDAILFDMDGTLVDSTAGVVGAWETFAKTYPGLDVQNILSTSHGVRTVENLQKHCGIVDPKELEREATRFEEAIITTSRENGREGIVLLPGVRPIMDGLRGSARWTICTSATRAYGSAALATVGIDRPQTTVFAEDVTRGKPMPDPYLLGAERCGISPEKCLVVEDAPAGVRSGKAAGCTTLALITSHTREQMVASGTDYLVENLASVTMVPDETGVTVTITTP
ncbi:phosphatase [Gloeopeniophorella convolvens]|nr:phosphatase [Gloeopeniophorella convolvens]